MVDNGTTLGFLAASPSRATCNIFSAAGFDQFSPLVYGTFSLAVKQVTLYDASIIGFSCFTNLKPEVFPCDRNVVASISDSMRTMLKFACNLNGRKLLFLRMKLKLMLWAFVYLSK